MGRLTSGAATAKWLALSGLYGHCRAMIDKTAIRSFSRSEWAVLAIAALLLAMSAAVWPVNHDEGQYVAATALMRDGLPYRDFAYLQTPLQPFVLQPLSLLPAGWLLAASRLANVLFASASLLLIALASKRWAPTWAVAASVAALACSQPFLFAASVARNDALPMMLLAGAVAVLVPAVDSARTRAGPFVLGGLLLGLATSAKISFALVGAGAFLFLLITSRRRHWLSISFFVLGGVAGLLPMLVMAALEPQRFFFDVFTYSLAAPQQWWSLVGEGHRLNVMGKFSDLTKLALRGAIIPALLITLVDRKRGDVCLFLDLMIVGGLIGAYLPDPAFPQYLVPVLPPLFARLAIALGHTRSVWRWLALLMLLAGSIYGLTRPLKYARQSASGGPELGQAVQQGRMTARLARGGTVVTLASERVAGSDVVLDPGFVTGPFLFRTHGWLAADALQLGLSPNWQRLTYLDHRPPAAILVGGEPDAKPPLHPQGLDHHLSEWARAHGYRAVALPGDGFTLFLRP